ncbi:N-acetyltransferase [Azorhizobium oxalatiphilum]|uniref:N-acetyltransferase n=1 Tax=Azorhizobium oxalatiphilum TaxID=980631 RepID=A0A917C0C0_9HYPH|nr:GNAT family N-acetyltransferase [Azorhizobium oxalatiphilum]GGF66225.1 N-acetyltransferase [Azorhizobium oxalatiphilum]
MRITRLDGAAAVAAIPALSDILLDCVAGGASVSFMQDMTRAEAEAFWRRIADDVAQGGRALLVAEQDGRALGTVQVILDTPPNQPHRGEIAKMLVHRDGRQQGMGAALMRAAEDTARQEGRTLLTLDTVPDEAGFRLYARLGWSSAGVVPGYALWPDGRPCDTLYMWKQLS